jgi:hypothetical protein
MHKLAQRSKRQARRKPLSSQLDTEHPGMLAASRVSRPVFPVDHSVQS